jgi:hypothetical protein
MIKTALMAFGVSAGALSALFFGALTACLLFISSGAAVARNTQGIVATALVLDARVATPAGDKGDDEIDSVQIDSSQTGDVHFVAAHFDDGTGAILPFLADDIAVASFETPRGLAAFAAVRPAIDGSDPSAGFFP